MRPLGVPPPSLRTWTALCVASVFGANLGDLLSHTLHLGHLNGLPLLLGVFAALLLLGSRASGETDAFYWAAVVLVRTAATNIADFGTHDLKLAPLMLAAILLAVLLPSAWFNAAAKRRTVPQSGPMPQANWAYWLALFIAGTIGTVVGDDVSDHLGLTGASILLSALLALVFCLWLSRPLRGIALYWTTIVAARTAGTSVGDFIVSRAGLGLGLPLGTLATGLLMLGAVAIPPSRQRPRGLGRTEAG